MNQPRLSGRSKRQRFQQNDDIPVEDGRILQQESKAQTTRHRQPRPTHGHHSD